MGYCKKFKGDFKVYAGVEPVIFLSNLKSVEAVLNSSTNLTKSKQYTFLKNWLGNGLLLSDGEYWRRHRKIITPAFHVQILDRYVETFNSATDILVRCMKEQSGKAAFNIYPYVTLCALDIICESAMGVPVDAQVNLKSEYVAKVKEMGRILMDRSFGVLQQNDFIHRFSKNYLREKEALKVLHRYSYYVIDQKKLENKVIGSETELTAKKKLAFLDLLLHHGSFTDEEVREEVDVLLFGGHDTTASGITFTLYCLANHPDIQEKAYQEVLSILTDDIRKVPTIQDLHNMRYLETVIKESLRLYPPVPFYGRKITHEIKCDDGRVLKKGSTVAIFAMGIQHDPNIFPKPYTFDPDRFSPEASRGRNPYSYLPFSAGPRNCIGQKFSMLEMKSAVSKILLHYKLLPSPVNHKMELIVETVLRSENGTLIGIENRM